MTTASRKCTQTRPLFWKIRIKSWSRNSFPSPFFTRRSQPGSALHVEGRLEAGRGRECPAQGPREAVGVHITAQGQSGERSDCWTPSGIPSGAPWACHGARRGRLYLRLNS